MAKATTANVSVSINIEELEALVARMVEEALANREEMPAVKVKEDEPAKAATKGKKAPAKGKAAKEEEAEVETEEDDEEEDEEDGEVSREEELEAMSLKELQKIAINLGYDKADVKDAEKETLVQSILEDEGDEEGEEEGEDEGEDDETRAELEAMTLTALKKVARTDYELTAADYKGMDKEALIDLILETAGDAEGDEDVDSEDDDEFEGYTEDELNDMSLAELREVAKDWELVVRAGTKKAGLVKLILESQEEEEDEDEDDE